MQFVEYSAQGEEGVEAIAEVARHVHAFNRDNGNALGIDFPDWSSGTALAVARRIRVFGQTEPLKKFIAQPRALRLLGMGHVARSAVSEAPVGAPLAAVVRDNAANKCKPAYIARQIARGGSGEVRKKVVPGFTLNVTSKTTGQAFELKMRKKDVEPGIVQFNSYGLCAAGGLPQF